MIKKDKWYKTEEDFSELTLEELEAFRMFLNMEAVRHCNDLRHIFKSIGIIECVMRRKKNESDRKD